ncbi:MAG: PhzF family phenazine biosynthesis protein [Arenimonas sp.]|nr:PhzF family phenazine biosynthesis protein [Arenimonas sp.]
MKRRFQQVDVFSTRAGAGNPLAVVFDAEGLEDERMQAIATWANLAETTFVLPPNSPDAHYRVRIFTTRQEIAFAGHPSIGTAHAILAAGFSAPKSDLLVQECRAGLLPIQRRTIDAITTLSVRVPRSRIVRYADSADELLWRALSGCALSALAPGLVEGGRRWWLAELADEAAVRNIHPNLAAIRGLAEQTQSLGLCVFARAPGRPYGLVVRAFPLGVGIVEDPASGAANAAIAAFLEEARALGDLGDSYTVSQGREMQRDAQLLVHIDPERNVWVGGQCQTVIRGEITW